MSKFSRSQTCYKENTMCIKKKKKKKKPSLKCIYQTLCLQRVYCPWKVYIPFQIKNASTAANFEHENRWHLETVRKNYINYRAITAKNLSSL